MKLAEQEAVACADDSFTSCYDLIFLSFQVALLL